MASFFRSTRLAASLRGRSSFLPSSGRRAASSSALRTKLASPRAAGALGLVVAIPATLWILSSNPGTVALDSQPINQAHSLKPSPGDAASGESLTRDEVAKHTTKEEGLWVIINDQVYDVSNFLDLHPGGAKVILNNVGKDATKLFKPIHPPGTLEANSEHVRHVGSVPKLSAEEATSTETNEETRIREARARLGHVDTVVNLQDFEAACKEILSEKAWAYYSSGSDDMGTVRSNADSFSRILFRPRVLRKVKKVDASTTILGLPSSLPIYISPAALARLGSEDGELHLTRAAHKTSILQCISSNSSCSLDEICAVRGEGQPLLWQYYVNADRKLARASLANALDHGMNSIWLTVDAPVGGKREADLRVQLKENPPTNENQKEKGASTSEQMFSYVDPDLSWEDLGWIREQSRGKSLVIKGIGSVEDAVLAIEAGVDGVVLSNHGGRQLNGGIPPIRILEELNRQHRDLLAQSKTEIYIDGGVTRGTDVLKAICLGARAVGLGRPFLYAQSAWGTAGAVKAVEIMQAEIELGMRLLGVTSLDELGPEYVEVLPM